MFILSNLRYDGSSIECVYIIELTFHKTSREAFGNVTIFVVQSWKLLGNKNETRPCHFPNWKIVWSLEHRRLIHDLILCFNIIHNRIAITQNDFFQLSDKTNARGHPFKLTVPLTRTNLRKYFFSSRVIQIWNSLHANIVNASTSSL